MKNKKNNKWFWYFLYFVLSTSVVLAITIPIIQKVSKTKTDSPNFNYLKFSEDNSFKIWMQTSDKVATSVGTAWSWNYKKTSDYSYDWYLMTNFHVINPPISYLKKLSTYQEQVNYFVNTITTEIPINGSYLFRLSKWKDDKYKHFISTNSNNNPTVLIDNIKSINVITDFNNNDIELFSKGDINDKTQSYNLDMALIKISFDFSTNNQNKDKYLDSQYQCPNVWEMYQQMSAKEKEEYKIKDDGITYIAGNPQSDFKLVQMFTENQIWDYNYKKPNLSTEILNDLKAPYFYLRNYLPYDDWKLSSGASGSAVYQFPNMKTNLNLIVPIAIYWGSYNKTIDSVKYKSGSFIPFVINETNISYNIFDNFKLSLNKYL